MLSLSLIDHLMLGLLHGSTPVTIDLLPMVPEQPDQRPFAVVKKPCLHRIDKGSVCVLIFVDQKHGVTCGQNGAKLRKGHRFDHQRRSEESRVGKECVSTWRSRWSTNH